MKTLLMLLLIIVSTLQIVVANNDLVERTRIPSGQDTLPPCASITASCDG